MSAIMLNESELALSRLGLSGLATMVTGIREELRRQLGIDDIPFPCETVQPFRDFKDRTFKLLSEVRGPTLEEQRALEGRGYVFLTTEAKPLAQVIREHPEHFGSVDGNLDLEAFVPPPLVVAMNTEQLVVSNSFGRPQATKLLMVDAYSQPLEAEFPKATALMLPASVYAQADIEYFRRTGRKLISNFFAHPLDQAVDYYGPLVGRIEHFFPLDVLRDPMMSIDMGSGFEGPFNVGAMPGLVFIKESYIPRIEVAPSMRI